MEKASLIEYLLNIFLFLTILLMNKNVVSNPLSKNTASYQCFTILCIIYCTYAFFCGDYYHYQEIYKDVITFGEHEHLEDVQNWIINILPEGYHIWRMALWGVAFVIYVYTFKRLQIRPGIAGMAITIVVLSYFPAPRQSMSFAIMLYGFSFITSPTKNKIISYITAILFLYLSTFFHKSSILYISIAAISFLPVKKNFFIISLLLFPILYRYLIPLSSNYINTFTADEKFMASGSLYLESDFRVTLTLWGWVQFIINRLPIVLLLGYTIKRLYFSQKGKYANNNQLTVYVKNAYILFYLGALFFNQEASAFLSGRFMDASLYPLAFVLAGEMGRINKIPQTVKFIIYAFIASRLYAYIHFFLTY